ncbi:MAG TPA: 50S ribosomal protein L3 N(5)-glutamine methyltransferase [Burkholderiales bacterium]|nr:50S ribosomal protein L3 N(5)-glutamine methyltransferase [Burkholderiales bacterium]
MTSHPSQHEVRTTLRTVRDLVRFAASRFEEAGLRYGHGTDNAFDEAVYLVLRTLHLPLDRLEPFFDARLLPSEIESVLAVLERRVRDRVPAAYLLHEAWMGDYRFYVDERVLVPRSHIAALVQQGLTEWIDDAQAVSAALDLCTGSGCLAVLMALAYPSAKVDATDISDDALAVAWRNVEDYGLQDRIDLLRSDLFAALHGRRYDLIVSNPPYVTAASMERLPPEYRHEPALALAAGDDGLDVVRRILAEARAYLHPGGVLVVEVGSGRLAVEQAFPTLPFTWLETGADDAGVFLLEREQLPAS